MTSQTTTAPGTAADGVDTRAVAAKPLWVSTLKTRAAAIFALDAALFIVFTASSDGLFASTANIQSLLLSGTEALLLAVGLALLLGAGIFDLSLGANLVLSSVVGAKLMNAVAQPGADGVSYSHLGWGITAGVVGCLVTGGLFGLVNGLLVAYLQINALIATLGTLGVGTGLAYVLTDGSDVSGLPPQIQESFGLYSFGGFFPLPALVALLVAALAYVLIRYTRFGSRTLAIGSSSSAADRVGIRVPRHLLLLAVLAGVLAGVAGFVDLAHFTSTSLSGHANDALNAVTAAVIGGTLLEGGKVSIVGAIWGTALAVLLQGGLVIIGVSSYYQLMVVGLVLIVAVGLDRITYLRTQRA